MTTASKRGLFIGHLIIIAFAWACYFATKKDAEIQVEVDRIAFKTWVQQHPNTRLTFEEFQTLKHHKSLP